MQPQHVEDGPSAVVVAALQPRRPPSLSLTSTQPGAARAGNTERKDNAAATTFASTSSGGGCRTLSPPLRQQQQQQQASRSAVGGSPTSLSSRARASIASLSLRHQWKLLVSPRNPSWRQSGGTSSTRPSPLSSPGVVRDELPAGGGCSGSPTHLSPVPGGPTPRLFTFNGPPPTSPLHARAAHAAAHAAVAASPVQTPAGTPRRRPTDLRVEHSHSHSGASLALDPDLRRSLSSAALAHAPSFLPTLASAAEQQQTSGRGVSGDGGQEQEQQQHPRDSMHFGDDGSLRLGGFDIGVGGLLVDTEGPDTAVSSSPSSPVPGIAASPCGRTPRFSLAASVSSASLSAAAAACAPEDASCSSASTQGQGNLIVVGRLGTFACLVEIMK